MNILFFVLIYLIAISIPGLLYLASLGGIALLATDPHAVSVVLGTTAFAVFSTQFLLAAKPRIALSALGTKGLLSFHGTMAIIALILAIVHKTLKEDVLGFPDDTVQTGFGKAAAAIFFIAIVLAAFLMANTFWMRFSILKGFKQRVYAAFSLSYPRMRIIHNITVIGGVLILFHVLLASTSDFSANPLGSLWVAGWMLFCLGAYGRYRLVGRKGSVMGIAR